VKTYNTFLIAFILQIFPLQGYAQLGQSYTARIQCSGKSATQLEYLTARNDMEAQNEVNQRLNSSSAYRGQGCKVIELSSSSPNRGASQRRSYELKIQCAGSSAGHIHYFSADSDLEAQNEARRIMNNNSGYRGKSCQIAELTSR
jgi:hypothetical protein